MYRFILLTVLTIAQGCHVPCHWHDSKPLVDRFNEIAHKLIDLDQILIDHCRANNVPSDVKYYHNDDEFVIVIPLPGFDATDVSVKAGRRLLSIEASNCEGMRYSDVRFIPDYLSLGRGRWSYDEEELKISIPYSSGSLRRKRYMGFNNRNLQIGVIALRKDRCCLSNRRSRRSFNSSLTDEALSMGVE